MTRDIADLQSERDFKLGIGTTSNSKADNLSEAQKDRIRKSYDKRIEALKQERLASRAGMTVADYKKKLANDSRKITKTANEQTGGVYGNRPKANLSQTPGGSKRFKLGTADPGTLGVSAILRERKELIAKRNAEGLSDEETKRLVSIQAESALRHQNRKAGKGTGPTKVALGDKKPSDAPKNSSASQLKVGDKVGYGSGTQTWEVLKINGDSATIRTSGDYLPSSGRRATKTVPLDKISRIGDKPFAEKILSKKPVAEARAGFKANGKPSADQEWAAKTYGGKPENYWFDKKTWNLVNGNPNTRDPNTTVTSLPKAEDMNDRSVIKDMPHGERQKLWNMRDSMKALTDKWLQRDNVIDELNAAKTVGELIDAAQSIYWYLDEMDQYGGGKTQPREQMDKMFTELKKYSNRYRSKSTAGVSQPPLRRNQHNPRAGVFGADKWGRRPGGR